MTPRANLATLVDDMHRLGQQAAVVEHRGVRRYSTSYQELALGAAWFAAELSRRGVNPGDRVVLWGENSAAWIACFFGCVLRGVLVVPIDAAGAPAFAERVIRDTAPQLIVADSQLLRYLPQEQAAPSQLSLGQLRAAMREPAAASAPTAAVVHPDPDTPLQILFTSGTTGEPKGIVHTHRNLLASLTPIEREIAKYRRYERVFHPLHILHTLPLSHVFGQFMGLWIAPVLGAVVHYESRLEAGRLLRLLRQERISVLAAVPRVLTIVRNQLLANHPGLAAELAAAAGERIGRRWLRFRRIHSVLGYRFWAIVCGGATLPSPLESFWTTLGVALIQGYGMTETSALVTLNHPFKPARGTLGAPLPGRELRIAETGELLVRGEMVATTIWQNGALRPAAASGGEEHGWLATGDLTRRDKAGRLHYLGRVGQRLVTSAGLNVYLQDVEAALVRQPGVNGAVALAGEGIEGQEPMAIVLASNRADAAQAVAAANDSLAPHQRVTRWWLWPGLDLPRTATGKVRRHIAEQWAREQLAAGYQAAAGQGAMRDPLLQLIAEVTARPAGTATQDSELEAASLESLGVDSLARVQLQAALERATGRAMPDSQLAAARSLGDVRRLAELPSTEPEGPAVIRLPASDDDLRPVPGRGHTELDSGSTVGSRLRSQPAFTSATPRPPTFLYPRWPWAGPVQLLRGLFLEAVVRPLVWLLAAPRISSSSAAATLFADQPFLIICNHVTAYDVPLLLYALPRPLRWRIAVATAGEMLEDWRHARGSLFGPVIYWLLTALFNVFPLPRSHSYKSAFDHAGGALDRGYSVLVFPEGARSHGGPLQPFRMGVGLLAMEADVPVIPVALRQARSKRGWRPYTATVQLGRKITVAPGEDARLITSKLEEVMAALLV